MENLLEPEQVDWELEQEFGFLVETTLRLEHELELALKNQSQ